MVSIYSVFPKDKVYVNDRYTQAINLVELQNVSIRVGLSSENNFITPIGVISGHAQSITNKQLYYVPEILNAGSGNIYPHELYSVYKSILETTLGEQEIIEEEVFYCMDFESTQGTGHSYDIIFSFLYYYKHFKLTCPFLIPRTDNHFINALYTLLEKYYSITFKRIEYNKTYRCKSLLCVRSELHSLRSEVKQFINMTLIEPILHNLESKPYYRTVAKIKQRSKHSMININSTFPPSESFYRFCSDKNIFVIDDQVSEEEKIFYMNKASNIIVCWGSIYYIYIHYYLSSTKNKHITVLYHKDMMSQRRFLQNIPGQEYIYQHSANPSHENEYNKIYWKGEIIENLETLDEFVEKTVLKDL